MLLRLTEGNEEGHTGFYAIYNFGFFPTSVLALSCSQVLINAPSRARFIVPLSDASVLPA